MTEGRRLLLSLLARPRTKVCYVAARCRVRPSTVYNWMAGRFVPCTKCRKLLHMNYGIPPDAWFTYTT